MFWNEMEVSNMELNYPRALFMITQLLYHCHFRRKKLCGQLPSGSNAAMNKTARLWDQTNQLIETSLHGPCDGIQMKIHLIIVTT